MSLVDKVEIIQFNEDEPDYTRDFSSEDRSGSWYYTPGSTGSRGSLMVRVHTEDGLTGEYAYHATGGISAIQAVDVARLLVGRDWQHRERLYRTARRAARPVHNYGLSFVDNALWDLAGKAYGASLTELLGGWRDRVRAYASTVNADRAGSLSTTGQIVDFFAELQQAGWTGFKMHSWHEGDKWEEAENVRRMREVLGERAELMLDPACVFDSLSDAIFVGKACQDAAFRWYEDPLRPIGVGAHQHRALREALDIPILQTEHVAGPEAKADFLLAGGTDLLRVDAHYDLGVTGSLKTIRFAESLGVNVEVHGPSPVHRHLVASLQGTSLYEVANVSPHHPNPSPHIYTCGYTDDWTSIGEDGTLAVPAGPGIGVSYDLDLIKKLSVATWTVTGDGVTTG
ncbi:enolase C-terminal domain-like protein [Streptomyces sp. NPDC059096]|uniref:enolase C-terminal domain-like protein n=1 Tax=Streptomyces sp. NPDC059096 TaxID=3346727 RepID=UPI003690B49B